MLKDILSISGKGGLYRLMSQATKGIIVESLETKQRTMIDQHYKVSSLNDIAIYTEDEEVPLKDIFVKMHQFENGKKASIKVKSSADDLKAYFEKILPQYDRERVYVSDIKKVIKWYNLLKEHTDIDFDKKEEEKSEEPSENEAQAEK
jgi:hypothetical protein